MALKITKTDEKPLLARKEITAQISFPEKATPSNAEIRKEIAAQAKANEKSVVVKHIYTSFGASEAKVFAYVYNTPEDAAKYEPVTKAMKAKADEEAKKAAEAAKAAEEAKAAEAAKPAEAPAEEKKE